MGGDIAAWCALRGLTVTLQDQDAERLSPGMQGASTLFAERLKESRRVRDATDRMIPHVDEGIAPETVDEAAVAFGMPMGPIELADTVGLDICMAVGRMLDPAVAPPAKLKLLTDAGKLGKKSGQGFYTWTNGKAQKQPAGAVPGGLAERLVGPFVA